MAALTVQERQVDPVFQAADAAGDTFQNDGSTELLIYNTGIADVVATAVARRACSQGFLDSWQKTVAGGVVMRFGPFAPNRFNDDSGVVTVSYADETDLLVAAQRQR